MTNIFTPQPQRPTRVTSAQGRVTDQIDALKNKVAGASENVREYIDARAPGLLPLLGFHKAAVVAVLGGVLTLAWGAVAISGISTQAKALEAQVAPLRAFVSSHKDDMLYLERVSRRGRSKAVPSVLGDIRMASLTGFAATGSSMTLKTRQYAFSDATGVGEVVFLGSESDYAAAASWVKAYPAIFQKEEQALAAKQPGYSPKPLPKIEFAQVSLATSQQGGTEVSFAITVSELRANDVTPTK